MLIATVGGAIAIVETLLFSPQTRSRSSLCWSGRPDRHGKCGVFRTAAARQARRAHMAFLPLAAIDDEHLFPVIFLDAPEPHHWHKRLRFRTDRLAREIDCRWLGGKTG
jgi:hypothetical protein